MLKLSLCLCFLTRLVHGQIDGYTIVETFSCDDPTRDNLPQLIIKTEESGNVSSPCYDGNRTDYTKELDPGLRLINITFDSTYLYAYQLIVEDFQIADSDRLFIGKTIVDAGRNSQGTRDFLLTSNSTSDGNIYVRNVEEGPVLEVLNWKDPTNSKLLLKPSEGFNSVFLDFYTVVDTLGGRGFSITYVADINRCEFTGDDVWCKNSGNCARTGVNTASCDCTDFWTGERCTIDVDECADKTDNCHKPTNATCINKDGGFDCECKSGYEGTGVNCADINECVDGSHNCDENAACNNFTGSFTCTCNADYTGNGTHCYPLIVLDNLNVVKTVNSLEISFDVTPRWSGPEYISMFTLSLSSLDGTLEREFDFNSTDLVGKSFTFTGLRIFTRYNLTIVIKETGSLFGASVLQNDVTTQIITTEELAAGVPINFRLSDTQRDRITLSWAKPIEFGTGSTDGFGKVLHYQVCYSPSTDGEKIANIRGISLINNCLVLDDTYTTITLTMIHSYLDLAFKIRAYSSKGYGQFTSVLTSFTGTLCPQWVGATRMICDGADYFLLQSDGFPRNITSSDNETIQQYWSFNLSSVSAWRINIFHFDVQQGESSLDYGYGDLDITHQATRLDNLLGNFTGILSGSQPPVTRNESNSIEDDLWFAFISSTTKKRPGFQVEIESDGNSCDSNPCLHGGICNDSSFGYSCDCTSTDWTGPICEYPHIRPFATCTTGKRNVNVSFQVQDEWKNDETVIGGYTISISNPDGDSVSKQISDRTADFTGLTPFTTYSVTVAVDQPDAVSLRDNTVQDIVSISCKTQEDAPGLVGSFDYDRDTSILTWTAPNLIDQNGGITGYTLTAVSTVPGFTTQTFDATVLSFDLTSLNLPPFTNYIFKLQAINDEGLGLETELTILTKVGVPATPSNLMEGEVNAENITISWEAEDPPVGNTIYIVSYSGGGTTASFETADTTTPISGLKPFTTYVITVEARTNAGISATAAELSVQTAEGKPGEVQTLKAEFVSDTYEIKVTWAAPDPLTGNLGEYTITWTQGDTTLSDTSPAVEYTIPNVVLSETEYLIEVYATTGGGDGPSVTITTLTPKLIPQVPENVTVTPGSTEVIVNINAPGTLTPDNYTITLSQDTDDCIKFGDANCLSNDQTNQPTPSQIPFTITGLKSYRQYTLSVVAKGPGGESAASEVVSFQTLAGAPNPVTTISTSHQPGEVNVTFVPGRPLTGQTSYTVTLTGGPTPLTETVTATDTVTDITVTFTDVDPNTEYTVEVVSTVDGQTASSPVDAAPPVTTNPETPTFTINAASATQLDITIDPAVAGATLYVATFEETGCGTNCTTGNATSTTTTISIQDLTPYTTYRIAVYAVSSAGQSAPSAITEVRTKAGTPNPPTNVQTKFLFDSVIVTFIPGKPFVGPASYLVTLTDEEGNTFTQTIDEPSELSNISVSITGINPDTTYSVKVETIINVPKRPETPTFEITRFSTDQLNVDITAVDGATFYVLSYVEVNCDTNCTVKEVKFNNTETIPITGLKPYTTYNISVYVVSALGESIAITKTERTKAGIPTLKDPDFKPIEATTTDTDISKESSVVLENHCIDKKDIFDEGNGAVTSVSYIAIEEGTTESYEVVRYYGQVFNLDPSPPYQAFTASCSNSTKRRKRELTSDQKIVIGADTSCTAESTTECNGPLKPGTTYTFRACGNTEDGSRNCTQPSDPITTDSASPQGLDDGEIAAIVICTILLLVFIAVIIICVISRRRKHQDFVARGNNAE